VVHVTPAGLRIEDLGSHNGTLVLASAIAPPDSETQGASATRVPPRVVTALADDAMFQIGPALITIQSAKLERRAASLPAGVIAEDAGMRRLLELADRIAPTQLTVLILGESGSGKEVLARYVHQQSPRARHRMVSLNCGALPEALLESELFGHEKGAFTGATAAKPGLFEAADGGTLFLDEVGELPLALQVKLLRVLEDRQVLRVGALEPRTVDVRFVAATNRDLDQQRASGAFREDLFYRLNGIALCIPPLRDRPADLVPLAERFVVELAEGLGRPPPALSRSAAEVLAGHPWPGNVRELRNVIHRALVMCAGAAISAADIALPERDRAPALLDDPAQLRQRAEDVERKRIVDALDTCAGNQTRAAELLGISRRVLIRRLDRYDIPRPRDRLRDEPE